MKEYTIALVAHDNCKADLTEWVAFNRLRLAKHKLVCTGTTGKLVEKAINKGLDDSDSDYVRVKRLKSGPLGGDQQLGAMICEGKIDYLFFFYIIFYFISPPKSRNFSETFLSLIHTHRSDSEVVF